MRAIVAVAMKDLLLLTRDRANFFFTFIFPVLFAIFFGLIFGGGGGTNALDIALVDEDGGPAAVAFAGDLSADAGLTVHEAPTRAEGEALVRRGEVVAAVVVPDGFEEGAGAIFSGGSIALEAVMDPTRKAEAGLLEGKLNELGFRQMTRTFGDSAKMNATLEKARGQIAGADDLPAAQRLLFTALFNSLEGLNRTGALGGPTAAALPAPDGPAPAAGTPAAGLGAWRPVMVTVRELRIDRKGPSNSFEISFPQGVAWGLLGCVGAFGASLAAERQRGTLIRLRSAPIPRGYILVGKALGCFIACVFVQGLLLAVATVGFGVIVRQPGTMAAAVLLSSFGFTGVMMAIAAISRTEAGASGMGRAIVLVLAMIGGGTVPLFMLPPFMETVSNASPFKWAILAVEGALWRTSTPREMLTPALALIAFGVAGFLVGVVWMRRSEA